MTNSNVRPLYEIASEIRKDWTKITIDKNGKEKRGKIYFGAVPYLDAMACLTSINDNYGWDSGKSIVSYFLANASTWRGDVAKRIKAELKKMIS